MNEDLGASVRIPVLSAEELWCPVRAWEDLQEMVDLWTERFDEEVYWEGRQWEGLDDGIDDGIGSPEVSGKELEEGDENEIVSITLCTSVPPPPVSLPRPQPSTPVPSISNIMADTLSLSIPKTPTLIDSPHSIVDTIPSTPTDQPSEWLTHFENFVGSLSPELQTVCRNAFHNTCSVLRDAEAVDAHGYVEFDKLTPDVLRRAGLTDSPDLLNPSMTNDLHIPFNIDNDPTSMAVIMVQCMGRV